jgi:hypothetical protein
MPPTLNQSSYYYISSLFSPEKDIQQRNLTIKYKDRFPLLCRAMLKLHVLTAMSIMTKVFWNVALCSLVETDHCFRGSYCHHNLGITTSTSEMSVSFRQHSVITKKMATFV